MAVQWTAEQANAIGARGGSLLISAGAGSGKTAVLTQRVVELLFDRDHPVDADRMLIVTFTRAAAQEMRQRIARKLGDLLTEDPGNGALRRQLILLERAQISTVHAFCQELIRQNIQRLTLSPDFRIADEKELEIWSDEAAAQVIEQYYEGGDPVFLELVELLSAGRDDRLLQKTVVRLYGFIRSHPFYEDWLEEKLGLYQNVAAVGRTPWGEILLGEARRGLSFALSEIRRALALMEGDEKLTQAYGEAVEDYRRQLEALLPLAALGDWDGLKSALEAFRFLPFGRLVKYEDPQRKARVTACRDVAKETVTTLSQKLLCATEAEFLEDIEDLRPKIACLFALTGDFGRALDERKAQRRAVDFSDLEHLALSLLMEKSPAGLPGEPPDYRPTAYAAEVAAGFDAIFVDEYQDTNLVQEYLFKAVSQGEANLFLVGDVKQSIYRFRQAMPELFLEKKERFTPYDGAHYPAKIDLNRNFRSRKEVTDGINYLFELLMTKELGEVDYAAGEQLIPGADYPPTDAPGCEVHLIDLSESEEEPVKAEAAHVAGEILTLLRSGLLIKDGGAQRPIRPGDIAILLRAPKEKGLAYREALEAVGVEAQADAQRGYLLSREISAVLSLLRVVDNPLLDVELAAALMSPLFSFTPDEMGEIRNLGHQLPFYLALTRAAEGGSARCQAFLALLGELRLTAATAPADEVITRLYDRTGAELLFGALEAGELRRQNLRLLIQHAGDCESRGYRGLSGFLRFVERLTQRGGDLTEASVVGGGGDSISILSIHKSKGLEFPVVFLCDCAKSFNTLDLRQNVLLHPSLGFACVRRDTTDFRQFPTVPMAALRLDLERSGRSEELRMLYVALTRAKERIILTGTVKNPERKMAALAGAVEGGRLPPARAAQGGSYLDWVIMALSGHPDGLPLRQLGGWELTVPPKPARFRLLLTPPPGADAARKTDGTGAFTAEPDETLLAALRALGDFVYPGEAATKLPTKLAISALAHESGAFYGFRTRPRFLYDSGLTPAEAGSALHKFMQFCDYTAARENPTGEIRRLLELGFLSAPEAGAISPKKLADFFASPLAGRIFAADALHREYRFLAEVGEELLGKYVPLPLHGYKTTLQGVADCIFIKDGKGYVVDYKTDHVKTPEELVERYRIQLLLYRELLEKALDIPIKACIIYSFDLGREILVEDSPQRVDNSPSHLIQ